MMFRKHYKKICAALLACMQMTFFHSEPYSLHHALASDVTQQNEIIYDNTEEADASANRNMTIDYFEQTLDSQKQPIKNPVYQNTETKQYLIDIAQTKEATMKLNITSDMPGYNFAESNDKLTFVVENTRIAAVKNAPAVKKEIPIEGEFSDDGIQKTKVISEKDKSLVLFTPKKVGETRVYISVNGLGLILVNLKVIDSSASFTQKNISVGPLPKIGENEFAVYELIPEQPNLEEIDGIVIAKSSELTAVQYNVKRTVAGFELEDIAVSVPIKVNDKSVKSIKFTPPKLLDTTLPVKVSVKEFASIVPNIKEIRVKDFVYNPTESKFAYAADIPVGKVQPSQIIPSEAPKITFEDGDYYLELPQDSVGTATLQIKYSIPGVTEIKDNKLSADTINGRKNAKKLTDFSSEDLLSTVKVKFGASASTKTKKPKYSVVKSVSFTELFEVPAVPAMSTVKPDGTPMTSDEILAAQEKAEKEKASAYKKTTLLNVSADNISKSVFIPIKQSGKDPLPEFYFGDNNVIDVTQLGILSKYYTAKLYKPNTPDVPQTYSMGSDETNVVFLELIPIEGYVDVKPQKGEEITINTKSGDISFLLQFKKASNLKNTFKVDGVKSLIFAQKLTKSINFRLTPKVSNYKFLDTVTFECVETNAKFPNSDSSAVSVVNNSDYFKITKSTEDMFTIEILKEAPAGKYTFAVKDGENFITTFKVTVQAKPLFQTSTYGMENFDV